jgi:hypothetical protein
LKAYNINYLLSVIHSLFLNVFNALLKNKVKVFACSFEITVFTKKKSFCCPLQRPYISSLDYEMHIESILWSRKTVPKIFWSIFTAFNEEGTVGHWRTLTGHREWYFEEGVIKHFKKFSSNFINPKMLISKHRHRKGLNL